MATRRNDSKSGNIPNHGILYQENNCLKRWTQSYLDGTKLGPRKFYEIGVGGVIVGIFFFQCTLGEKEWTVIGDRIQKLIRAVMPKTKMYKTYCLRLTVQGNRGYPKIQKLWGCDYWNCCWSQVTAWVQSCPQWLHMWHLHFPQRVFLIFFHNQNPCKLAV